jgi:hyperosmotically inducible periplasmic protein
LFPEEFMTNQNQGSSPAVAAVVDIAVARAANASATAAATATAVVAAAQSQDVIDARQESQIWTTFALSHYLRSNGIKATVRQGKATLTGNVSDGVSKDLAQHITLAVSGIKTVDNHIVVHSDYLPAMQSAERTFAELVDDAAITAAVRSKILWSRYGESLSANVETQHGSVTLTGKASSAEAKDFAGKMATNTQGARSVNNQLALGAVNVGIASADVPGISDSWIDAKVMATFLRSASTDRAAIAVKTVGGIVKLTGKMDNEAGRSMAIELAGNVRGVKSVDSSALTI